MYWYMYVDLNIIFVLTIVLYCINSEWYADLYLGGTGYHT